MVLPHRSPLRIALVATMVVMLFLWTMRAKFLTSTVATSSSQQTAFLEAFKMYGYEEEGSIRNAAYSINEWIAAHEGLPNVFEAKSQAFVLNPCASDKVPVRPA